MKYTAEGKPIITFKNFEFVLTSQDPKNVKSGKYTSIFFISYNEEKEDERPAPKGRGKKKVQVVKSHVKKETDVLPLDLKGMETNKMSIKNRNKVSKVFKKYIKDGFIEKSDAENIQKDLDSLKLDESSILEKIDLLIG